MRTTHAAPTVPIAASGAGLWIAVVAGVALYAAASLAAAPPAAAPPAALRVCADPNNLPFSNADREGFENRLAELLAADLKARLEYTWWPQRRGFIRNTLDAGACDVVMGVPAGYGLTLTTAPYYRSTYVFVSRQGRHPGLRSLDDARLKDLRIGVQLVGDDFANSPPAHALSARGLTANVVGYSVLGDYSRPNPPARIVEAVARGEIDAALVWGPLAGYFARRSAVALELSPIAPDRRLPFAFDVAMGVRHGDTARQRVLDRFLARRRAKIVAILDDYGVPRLAPPRAGGGS
jgi:quinoprotein dehydrogenase-associated probable ABC transporter substrate-binding protein